MKISINIEWRNPKGDVCHENWKSSQHGSGPNLAQPRKPTVLIYCVCGLRK